MSAGLPKTLRSQRKRKGEDELNEANDSQYFSYRRWFMDKDAPGDFRVRGPDCDRSCYCGSRRRSMESLDHEGRNRILDGRQNGYRPSYRRNLADKLQQVFQPG